MAKKGWTGIYKGPKMDLHMKAQWIEALTSGRYTQGRDSLCHVPVGRSGGPRIKRFCCLGVAADVIGGVTWKGDPSGNFATTTSTSIWSDHLPAGGQVVAPYMDMEGLPAWTMDLDDFFVHANDGLRWSFKKIAQWVDQNL